jgi:hypothetical protein
MSIASCAEGRIVLPSSLFAAVIDFPSMYLRRRQITGLSITEFESQLKETNMEFQTGIHSDIIGHQIVGPMELVTR